MLVRLWCHNQLIKYSETEVVITAENDFIFSVSMHLWYMV